MCLVARCVILGSGCVFLGVECDRPARVGCGALWVGDARFSLRGSGFYAFSIVSFVSPVFFVLCYERTSFVSASSSCGLSSRAMRATAKKSESHVSMARKAASFCLVASWLSPFSRRYSARAACVSVICCCAWAMVCSVILNVLSGSAM